MNKNGYHKQAGCGVSGKVIAKEFKKKTGKISCRKRASAIKKKKESLNEVVAFGIVAYAIRTN